MRIKAPDKKDKKYCSKHELSMSLGMHIIGIVSILPLIYLYFDDSEGTIFWFMMINNAIFYIPYLLTLYRLLMKQKFIIEIKECEDEIQINYYNGREKFKSIVCKYKDIRDWGVTTINSGIGKVNKAYIKDKYKKYVVTFGHFPLDVRGKPANLYAEVAYADISEALRGNVNKNGRVK